MDSALRLTEFVSKLDKKDKAIKKSATHNGEVNDDEILTRREAEILYSLQANIQRLESLKNNGSLNEAEEQSLEHDKNALKKQRGLLGRKLVLQYNYFRKLWADEFEYIFRCGHTELTIAKQDIPAYRNEVIYRLKKPNHPILEFMRFSKSKYDQFRQEGKERYEGKVGQRAFYDREGYIAQTERMLCDTRSYMKIALGLCAATGRRPAEILMTAIFEPVKGNTIGFPDDDVDDDDDDDGDNDDNGDNGREYLYRINVPELLLFHGQLKTGKDLYERKPYTIPTLVSRDLVLSAFYRLRSMKDFKFILDEMYERYGHIKEAVGFATKALNTKTNKTQKETVVRYYKPFFDDKITPYDLRHIYPLLITELYADAETKEQKLEDFFFPRLLGHREGDQETKVCYQDFRLESGLKPNS